MALTGTYVLSQYFEHNQGGGWSENIALSSSGTANITVGLTNAVALANARVAFMSADVSLNRLVIRQLGQPRDSEIPSWSPTVGSIAGNCNMPNDAVVFTFAASIGASVRKYWAHGVPDAWIKDGVLDPALIGTYTPLFTTWLNIIKNGSWAIKSATANSTSRNIASIISPALGSDAVITTSAPHALTVGQLLPVVIRGYRGDPKRLANGSWAALVTGASTLTLIGSYRFQLNNGAGGLLYPAAVTNFTIGFANLVGVDDRKIGRPFGLPRGRRSSFLLHQ